MDFNNIEIDVAPQKVQAKTYPSGPRGIGIKTVTQNGKDFKIVFDDGREQIFSIPGWWFGTREEYNSLSEEEKKSYTFYFIEEGS